MICGPIENESVVTDNKPVWEIRKSVGPGHHWTGESGSWMSSSEAESFASAAKNFVRRQCVPFDEDGSNKNIVQLCRA